jgi:hypothetical protein
MFILDVVNNVIGGWLTKLDVFYKAIFRSSSKYYCAKKIVRKKRHKTALKSGII